MVKLKQVSGKTLIKMYGQQIRNVHFSNCTFPSKACFVGSHFINCTFTNCTLTCQLWLATFDNCKFTECEFWHMRILDISLYDSTIEKSNFHFCCLRGISGGLITECELQFCEISKYSTQLENYKMYNTVLHEPESDDI